MAYERQYKLQFNKDLGEYRIMEQFTKMGSWVPVKVGTNMFRTTNKQDALIRLNTLRLEAAKETLRQDQTRWKDTDED